MYQNWAETQADRPLLGQPAWHLQEHGLGFDPAAMKHTHEALSRGLGFSSIGYTERHQLWAKDSQGSPNSKVIQQPTSLEGARRQSEASAKPETEMGQREAGRLGNCIRQPKPTANRLQEKIRTIVRKAVDTCGIPRLAGPTWKPLKLGFGVEVKHNCITCFQPMLPAVTARTDLGRAINRSTIHHSRHTPLELFSFPCAF